MIYSKKGLELTKNFEGCKLRAYKDIGGVWTIGYGRTIGVKEGQTCTQAQAENWLLDDLQVCVSAINQRVHVQLTQGEFDALVDFAFNLGAHALFGSTLWKYIEAGDFDHAAEQFPRWQHAGGKKVAGLLRRRMAEKALFEEGQE